MHDVFAWSAKVCETIQLEEQRRTEFHYDLFKNPSRQNRTADEGNPWLPMSPLVCLSSNHQSQNAAQSLRAGIPTFGEISTDGSAFVAIEGAGDHVRHPPQP